MINSFRFGWYQPIVVDGDTVDGFTPISGDAVVKELGIQGVQPSALPLVRVPEQVDAGLGAVDETLQRVEQQLLIARERRDVGHI